MVTTKHAKGAKKEMIVYRKESYRIIVATFDVYKERGNGLLETVYQECLMLEFVKKGIPFSLISRVS